MKKLMMSVALTLACTSYSQAAQRSEYCDMAKNQRNIGSWNATYHCIDAREARAEVPVVKPAKKHPNEYCNLASFQRNAPSWNEYYHCR
jgi:hypothetical protein